MKATKNIFERKEKKHVITHEQMILFLSLIEPYMEKDFYYDSNIKSTYYDTDDYSVVEYSLTKPKFKEKLRVRSYGTDSVFVELKKKYDGIVYKRRIEMKPSALNEWFAGEKFDAAVEHDGLEDGKDRKFTSRQIAREIDYYRNHLPDLSPAIDIYAHRLSYKERGKEDGIRITFDVDVWYDDLRSDAQKTHLIDDVVLEIKSLTSYPLWLVHALNEVGIYPQTFTKYGTAYKAIMARKAGLNVEDVLPRPCEKKLGSDIVSVYA